VPGRDTVSARLDEEPAWMYGGMVALERGFPTVERDYSSMSLHECWESDGRRADVFCRWDDGTITRPFVIAIRDVRSRRVLAIRVCRDPDTEAVLGVFGAAMANTQAIPRYFKLDNGREYANKMFTGHQTTRYRNKYKIDEAIGILTLLDVKVHWSKPGNGRDKPIESWWNVIAENCDKNPMFAGAYCGKDVLSKPEDHHKDKAAPVEAYGAKLVETIKENEHRPHRGHGMNGRSAYEVSEELALTTVTRKPNASELRRCKMGVKSLSLDKKDSSIRFKMDGFDMPMKYWNEALADLSVAEREGKFNVYFDWGEPNTPVSVYRGDVFICDAAPLGRIDFIEAPENSKVKEHMETKGKFMKQRKNAINAAKQGGAIALPSVNSPMNLPPMIAATHISIIAPSTKIRAIAAPVSPIQAVPGRPGESIDTETGEIYKSEALNREEAKAREKQREQETDAELEEMRRKQREKNLPAYMR
jgi:putative transposase